MEDPNERAVSSTRDWSNAYITHLLILGQVHKHGDEVCLQVFHFHHLRELAQLSGSGTTDHRGVILAEVAELTAQFGCK